MPRDGTDTRARLLEEAERVFASRGVYQATVREIIEAAGQKNVSALTYHFGSREGVLLAILTRHGDALDQERGRVLSDPIEKMPTRELVAALLMPLATELSTPSGRNYLRIVAQLAGRYQPWRRDALNPTHQRGVLAELQARASATDVETQQARVMSVIMLMTTAMADRARALDEGAPVELDEETFLANLADMIVAALTAARGPRLRQPAEAQLRSS